MSSPLSVAFTPSGDHAYVTNNGSATVSVIETEGHTVVTDVDVAVSPVAVGVTGDGGTAYVTHTGGSNSVSAIETANHTVVATVPVGIQPVGLAITPNPTPEERIEALVEDVQELVDNGTLTEGEANSLTQKLDAALESLERGNENAGVGQLNAFINEVEALVKSDRLTAGEGQGLIDQAQAAIDQIKAASQ